MKKLICVKDVDLAKEHGKKVMYVDNKTIITPAAKDVAKINGIEFSFKQENQMATFKDSPIAKSEQIDSEMIYKALTVLMDKGLLQGLIDQLSGPSYIAEYDTGGLKVVRGNTVKYEKYDTKNPNDNVYYQELMKKNESSIGSGFLTIEKSSFERELSYEEMNYVIEGTLTVAINGKSFTVYSGDVVYVPSGSKAVWSTTESAKLFYTKSC